MANAKRVKYSRRRAEAGWEIPGEAAVAVTVTLSAKA
jgi:hypothetical protein